MTHVNLELELELGVGSWELGSLFKIEPPGPCATLIMVPSSARFIFDIEESFLGCYGCFVSVLDLKN